MDIDQWTLATIALKWAIYATALFAAGTALFRIFVDRNALLPVAYGRTAALAALGAACLTPALIALRAGFLIDDGLSGMVDTVMLQLAAEGALGQAVLVRVVCLLLLATSAFFLAHAAGQIVAIVACIGLALSFALIGHAVTAPRVALAVLIMVHVLSAAFWIGALLPLHGGASGGLPQTAVAAERFGRIAVFVVSVLVLAGVSFLYLRLPDPMALLTSDYGRVLGLKLLAVVALLGAAAMNKLRLVPALARADVGAHQRLCGVLRLEALLFSVILLATAVLTSAVALP